jgi:hypothetical protein
MVAAKAIKEFLADDVVEADCEESVGVYLEGRHRVKRGQILAGDLSSVISDRIQANIFWLDQTSYQIGEGLLFRCVTQEVPCRIEKISRKFDPASMELTKEDASSIQGTEVADILIQLDGKAVVDPFNEIPEMGRFVLEKDERPVAGESFCKPPGPFRNRPSISQKRASSKVTPGGISTFSFISIRFLYRLHPFMRKAYQGSETAPSTLGAPILKGHTSELVLYFDPSISKSPQRNGG